MKILTFVYKLINHFSRPFGGLTTLFPQLQVRKLFFNFIPNKTFNYSDAVKRHRRSWLENFVFILTHFLSIFLSYTPWKDQKSYVFRGCKVGTLGSNGLIMIILIYTKQIIYLSDPLDETSSFARDRLILVLGQKGDLPHVTPK